MPHAFGVVATKGLPTWVETVLLSACSVWVVCANTGKENRRKKARETIKKRAAYIINVDLDQYPGIER